MSRRHQSLLVGFSLVLALVIFAGCYPFQGDVTLLLTPVPPEAINPEVVATAQALAQAGAEGAAPAEGANMMEKLSGEVVARSLRVRQGPDTESEVVAGLKQGEQVTVIGRNADGTWLQVQMGDTDVTGWVAAEFISITGDTTSLPVTSPEAAAPASGEAMVSIAQVVTVEDQPIVDGTVTVAEVTAAQDGWMVIHAQKDGGIGPVIGFAPVVKGANKDVVVKIDTAGATETLYAMLHKDEGTVGTYEFPGPDGPVVVDGAPLSPSFMVTGGLPMAEAAPSAESAAPAQEAMAAPMATVLVRSARVHLGPAMDAPVIAGASKGESFTVVGRTSDGSWLELDLPNLVANGWVVSDLVSVEGDLASVPVNAPVALVTVTTGGPRLRVRSAPSLDAEILGYVFDGEVYNAIAVSEDGEWVRIEIPGMEGETWVSAKYVSDTPVN